MGGKLGLAHGPLVSATSILMRVARRLGVPPARFERHGWLPVPLHFYHPYPSEEEVAASDPWSRDTAFAGVDIDLDACAGRLEEWGRTFGEECRWPEHSDDPRTYHASNGAFGFTSAAVAHTVLRRVRPGRVVEVGSGYSTHVLSGALVRNAADGGRSGEIVSIEPYPATILDCDIPHLARRIERRVETVELDVFDALDDGDVLFIDSSHIIRYGGDVLFLYLEILPRLRPGVVVHIHDIHLPEAYPRVYYDESRYVWNEQCLLQAFLVGNRDFEVWLPCWWLHRDRPAAFEAAFPAYRPGDHRPGSSFWMRRRPTTGAA